MINKNIFFCEGDSSCASVWSNVAYLLSANLEKRGILIVRIDTSALIKWKNFYKNTIYRITHKFYPGNACFFTRSWLYYIYVRRNSPDYRIMCISAHEHVKDYTWSNYA